MLSFSSILNEIVKDSIEALHYCKIDVKFIEYAILKIFQGLYTWTNNVKTGNLLLLEM